MDYAAPPARIPRFYRQRQNIPLNEQDVDPAPTGCEPEPRRENMGRAHRFFHRRAVHGNTRVITVAVEVVATVDTNGKVVAEETLAPVTPQAPTASVTAGVPASQPSVRPPAQQPLPSVQLPAVPAVPTVALPVVPAVPTVPAPVLPSVPAVPPFPSDLTVPGYPFSTRVPVAQPASPETLSASPVPTGGPGSTVRPSGVPDPALLSSIHSGNSTESSTALSSSVSLDSISASTATELVASIAAAPNSASASQSLPTSSSSRTSSKSSTPSTSATSTSAEFRSTSRSASTPDASTTAVYYGDGGGNAPGTVTSSAAATSTASGAAASSPSPLETPQVVGSIIGSLAGAALILALILLLLRRHKRQRGGALQLTGDDHTDNAQSVRQAPVSSNLVPAAFLHRFSAMSSKTADTTTSAGEKSFQRVSGRKLPSAFSEGMTSEQFAGGSTMSGSSFYQDEHGVYVGPALSKEFGKEIGDTSLNRESGPMNIRPSPAKTPVIRHPDDGNPFSDRNYLSPPQSPNTELPPRGTLGRSLPSADGSRSSRFTENV
ncbi:hypothetical protein CFE70_002418 [Pyrenophora teres f. teres 0-1]|uniref:Uncharacterized protein n=1 Tax=Pyrenophora teres f. teres (strain 0-1) TaxID=861557 RepID=E3S6V2_PYRTT|nr:hypothetical protein PTT_18507 [Pyrenophora teres f. teres 0-1]KAE8870681.1 hypothetical protein PTNB29_01025 [Pyrenophora teres f. teres]